MSEKLLKGAGGGGTPVLGVVSNAKTVTKTTTKKQAPVKAVVKPRLPKVQSTTRPGKTSAIPSTQTGGAEVAGITTQMSTPTLGMATVVWTNPGGVTKYHLYYWSSTADQHAVRDLTDQANTLTINSLNVAKTYLYRIQAVKYDGQTMWLNEAKTLAVQ